MTTQPPKPLSILKLVALGVSFFFTPFLALCVGLALGLLHPPALAWLEDPTHGALVLIWAGIIVGLVVLVLGWKGNRFFSFMWAPIWTVLHLAWFIPAGPEEASAFAQIAGGTARMLGWMG